MATKAMNLKLDESLIADVKDVAAVFSMTLTDFVKEALEAHLKEAKEDPFYKLTANVAEASREESVEILSEIDSLSEDDLEIAKTEEFTLEIPRS